jgi:hypothetical protein
MKKEAKQDWETDRDYAKRSRLGHLYWCWGCDRNLVHEGQKCEVCGYIDGKRRRHKREIRE